MKGPGRDAFIQLVGVLLVSGGLRAVLAPAPSAGGNLPGTAADPGALADSAAALAAEEARRATPLAQGERLDPNRAPEEELDRLPGVGPATAQAVVQARDSLPFASVEDLLRVRGIGPATLERLRPMLEVEGGRPLPLRTGPAGRGTAAARPLLPGAVPGVGSAAWGREGVVELNRAGLAELESLPGVGPVLARRIVATRDRRGGFSAVDDLLAVPGIGPVLLEKLRSRVRVGP